MSLGKVGKQSVGDGVLRLDPLDLVAAGVATTCTTVGPVTSSTGGTFDLAAIACSGAVRMGAIGSTLEFLSSWSTVTTSWSDKARFSATGLAGSGTAAAKTICSTGRVSTLGKLPIAFTLTVALVVVEAFISAAGARVLVGAKLGNGALSLTRGFRGETTSLAVVCLTGEITRDPGACFLTLSGDAVAAATLV